MGIFDRIRGKPKTEEESISSEDKVVKVGEKITGAKTSQMPKILPKLRQVFKEYVPREEEIRLIKEESLQQLVNKLCLQLADFWGIPRSKISVPRVLTFNEKDAEGMEKSIPIAAYMSAPGLRNVILVNEDYLANEFQSGLLNIKSAMAEEVCHFLEILLNVEEGVKSTTYILEFFGMISRLFISEQIPELFRIEYRQYLHKAANFSTEKKSLEEKINKTRQEVMYYEAIIKKQPKIVVKAWTEKIRNKFLTDYEDALDSMKHLSYYPAAAYYYEIKKLTPEIRYQMLKSDPITVLNYIIQPAQMKLEEIRNKIEPRQERLAEEAALADLGVEPTPSLKKTFELKCGKCGKMFDSEEEFYKHPCARFYVKCPVCGSEEIEDIE